MLPSPFRSSSELSWWSPEQSDPVGVAVDRVASTTYRTLVVPPAPGPTVPARVTGPAAGATGAWMVTETGASTAGAPGAPRSAIAATATTAVDPLLTARLAIVIAPRPWPSAVPARG